MLLQSWRRAAAQQVSADALGHGPNGRLAARRLLVAVGHAGGALRACQEDTGTVNLVEHSRPEHAFWTASNPSAYTCNKIFLDRLEKHRNAEAPERAVKYSRV